MTSNSAQDFRNHPLSIITDVDEPAVYVTNETPNTHKKECVRRLVEELLIRQSFDITDIEDPNTNRPEWLEIQINDFTYCPIYLKKTSTSESGSSYMYTWWFCAKRPHTNGVLPKSWKFAEFELDTTKGRPGDSHGYQIVSALIEFLKNEYEVQWALELGVQLAGPLP